MKNNIIITFILTSACWIIIYLFAFRTDPIDNKLLESKNKDSEAKIKKALVENDSIKKQIIVKDKLIDSLILANKLTEGEIIKINQEANEKIKMVDNFTVSELQQYFTNRYPGLNSGSGSN